MGKRKQMKLESADPNEGMFAIGKSPKAGDLRDKKQREKKGMAANSAETS